MNVTEAVRVSRRYVAELLADEQIANLGLEGVEYDEPAKVWNITPGFSRSRGTNGNLRSLIAAGLSAAGRSCHVVRVRDPSGEIVSFKRRDTKE